MSNIVYWADFSQDGYFLNIKQPQKIINKNEFNNLPDLQNFFRCPAFLQTCKTTFNVLSPIDYDLHMGDDNFYSTSLNQEFFEKNVIGRSLEYRMATLLFAKYIFFTESESCTMSYGDAYYSNSNFTKNASVMCGQFDIAKWFRPTDLSFFFKEKNGGFFIKENDPLFSVTFNFGNTKPVIFKKFIMTEKLFKYSNYVMGLKYHGFDTNKYKITEFFYEMYKIFNESKIKHLILKEIKNNLME